MKRKVVKNSHNILEEQSEKLKNKLEVLKSQIEMKKKEKEQAKLHRISESNINTFHNIIPAKSKEKNFELRALLTDLKIDNIELKLNEKGVYTLSDFLNISSQQIDKWKDIAVGYRIRIKKYLSVKSENKGHKSQQRTNSIQKQKDIEEIILNRNKDKNFIPIHAHFKENQEIQTEQLGQEQQQKMINNLMNAFQSIDIQDEWQQTEVKDHQLKEQPMKLSQVQEKAIWRQIKVYPDHQYCWNCLHLLNQNQLNQYNNRQFCSENCIEAYKSKLNRQNDQEFYQEIQNTEQKFNDFLSNRGNKEKNSSKQIVEEENQNEDSIDFSIS